jgi:hypothetical protein
VNQRIFSRLAQNTTLHTVSMNFGLRSACDTKERNWQQHTIHLLCPYW